MLENVLAGAVDCYVHGGPDPIARRCDDIDLARECSAAGYAAAVHRHHFADTTGRAELARAVTGFGLLGALVLGDATGGINPTAVELALRAGGTWISLPTLSSAVFRAGLRSKPAAVRGALGLGPGQLRLLDDRGRLRPEVRSVIELTGAHDAVLGLGYGDAGEVLAVVRSAGRSGPAMVLTYPHIAGLSVPVIAELLALGDCYLELCAYRLHPAGPAGGGEAPLREALRLLDAAGADRTILSSDGGIEGAPSPPALLAFGLRQLAEAGVPLSILRRLVHDNPRRLLAKHLNAAAPTNPALAKER
jgi:hypothetical protein